MVEARHVVVVRNSGGATVEVRHVVLRSRRATLGARHVVVVRNGSGSTVEARRVVQVGIDVTVESQLVTGGRVFGVTLPCRSSRRAAVNSLCELRVLFLYTVVGGNKLRETGRNSQRALHSGGFAKPSSSLGLPVVCYPVNLELRMRGS